VSRSSVRICVPSPSNSKRIVGLFPQLVGVGGVQEAGRQTAAALDDIARRRGWSLDLLSLNDEPGAQALCLEEREIPFLGFGRAKIRFVLSALGHAGSETQIVLAAHPHLAVPAWLMRTRTSRWKMIVMSHGIEIWKRLPFLRRRALLRADCVLAPSSDTARKLTEVQGVRNENIRKLPWPLNAQILRFADAPSNLPLPPAFPQGQVVLTVGRWAASERYKGADDLLGAVAQLRASIPNLYLVAVGGGDDLPRLRTLAMDLGVGDRVSFFEGLSPEQIAACYAHCDIFALPSTGEGFGLVFLEAMAFSKPVVGADAGGIPDLIQNDANGVLIPAHDREQLGKALELLLRGPSLRARLGAQGAEMVRRKHTFSAFEAGLDRVIEGTGLDSGALKEYSDFSSR
jgi:phosphatidylinositol alpha-1,6-mannosyltransferase